jgi:anti-sigma factor RsiW
MQHQEDETGELLWRYVAELKRAEDPEAVNFVARTPADPADVAALLPLADAVHEALREETTAMPPDPAARARLESVIRAARSPAARRSGLLRKWPGTVTGRPLWQPALAALALVAVLALVLWSLHGAEPDRVVTLRAQSMIRDHQEFVEDPGKVAIRGSDPVRVAAALSPQLGYRVTPVDLSLAGANLLGGRRCTLDRQPIAFFMYRAAGDAVSLYELRAPRCRLPGMAEKTREGRRFLTGTDGMCNVLAWRSGDRLYVLVSALATDRLLDMALHVAGNATSEGAGDTL